MNKRYGCFIGLCCLAMFASAVDISMVANNALGNSSFNSGTNWSNGLPPGAGTNYFLNGYSMRTPEGAITDNYLFAGDSLTMNGGSFAWKSKGTCTINNLIADGGKLNHAQAGLLGRLYGNIWINSGKIFEIAATDTGSRDFDIYSQISGPGDLRVDMRVRDDLASKTTMLHGVNTNFSGKVIFQYGGHLGFTDERALGPNPATYTDNQLSINGGWIYLTNSIAIDDPNRGINLLRTTGGLYGSLYGGGFDVAEGATATVSCVINGGGDLSKQGAGTLVLATNETYIGKTIVNEGLLLVASNATLASPEIVLKGGSLGSQASGCQIENLVFDGGAIVVDPSIDDPATARVTVSDTISKSAFNQIIVSVQNLDTIQQEFKILDCAGLDNIGAHDLCLNPPWAGFLSVQDNGAGGKVLVLTTQPESKIVYQTASDDLNHSALLDANWTDNLAPSAGKIYVNNAFGLRTPPTGNHTFAGDRLIIDGAGRLAMKNSEMVTANDMVAMNSCTMSLVGPPNCLFAGNITLHAILKSESSYALSLYSLTPYRAFQMHASLHGYGDLYMVGLGDPTYKETAYSLLAKNTNFFGRIRLDGNTNFSVQVTCEENLGGSPPAFRTDQLIFNDGGISVTNDVAIDDPNRVITLLDTGGYCPAAGSGPGGYPYDTPQSNRWHAGGAVFIADLGQLSPLALP